jgi:hypothetical protein
MLRAEKASLVTAKFKRVISTDPMAWCRRVGVIFTASGNNCISNLANML